MPEYPVIPKFRAAPANGGAAAHKVLIVTATVLLSVCASVFTFLAMTKFEARMAKRNAAGSAAPAAARAAGNEYGGAAEGYDGAPAAETNYYEMTLDIVVEGLPSQTPEPAPPQPARPPQARRQYAPAQPFNRQSLQNTPQASPRTASGVPYMIDNASPDIHYYALTFDGGSYAAAAGEIFDTLASRGVKSTIFVTGEFIRRFPGVITRAAREGHETGNHMQRHPRLTTYAENRTQSTRPGVTRQFVVNELEGAARMLADRTGLRFAPLWRAPYGEYNRQICEWAAEAGYVHIGWRQGGSWVRNLDTNDWVPNEDSPAYRTPQEVYDKIVNIARQPGGLNGGIILMHLGTERKVRSQQVHIILGRLIDTLREMGYEPVTVSELLYRSGIDLKDL